MTPEAWAGVAAAAIVGGWAVFDRVHRWRANGRSKSLHQEADDAAARTLTSVREERDELRRKVEALEARQNEMQREFTRVTNELEALRAQLRFIPNGAAIETTLHLILVEMRAMSAKLDMPGGLLDLERSST